MVAYWVALANGCTAQIKRRLSHGLVIAVLSWLVLASGDVVAQDESAVNTVSSPLQRIADEQSQTANNAVISSALATLPSPLKIVIGHDSYPYQYADEQGNPAGLFADIWRLWSKRTGHSISLKALPWHESVKALRSGAADIHGAMAITEQRQQQLLFGQPLLSSRLQIFVHRDLQGINSIEDLLPYRIGITKGASAIDALNNRIKGLQFEQFNNLDDIYAAASSGKIKVFVSLDRISRHANAQAQLAQLYPAYKRLTFAEQPVSYAFNAEHEQWRQTLVDSFSVISSKELADLERQWRFLSNDKDAVILVFNANGMPYMGQTVEGNATGLLVDIWRTWAKKVGREVVFVAEETNRALDMLSRGQADIHIGFPDLPLPSNDLTKVWQIYQLQSKLFITKTDSQFKRLAKPKVGVFKTAPYFQQLQQKYPDWQLQVYPTLNQLIQAALNREIDGFMAAEVWTWTELRDQGLHQSFHVYPNVMFTGTLSSIVGPVSDALRADIERGIAQISPAELASLEALWIHQPSHRYYSNLHGRIGFSDDELRFMQQTRSVALGALRNWPPFEFVGSNGEFQGLSAELIKVMEQRTGLIIQLKLYDNWGELLNALKLKHIDMIANASATTDRQVFASFSDVYWTAPYGVASVFGQQPIIELQNRQDLRLAVIRDYEIMPELLTRYPNIDWYYVNSAEEGVLAVERGYAQGYVDSVAALGYLVKKQNALHLSVQSLTDVSAAQASVAVRKDLPALHSIVGKVLASLQPAQLAQMANLWFQTEVQQGLAPKAVWQNTIKAVLLVALLLAVAALWLYKLNKEIRRRKALEEKLRHIASHDDLTGLPNRVLLRDRLAMALASHQRNHQKLAVVFIDLDGFKAINDHHNHQVGDQLLQAVAQRLAHSVRQSDTVARISGDEFVLLLTQVQQHAELSQFIEKIRQAVEQPYGIGRYQLQISASFGVVCYPEDGEQAEALLASADALMYRAKANGKNQAVFSHQ